MFILFLIRAPPLCLPITFLFFWGQEFSEVKYIMLMLCNQTSGLDFVTLDSNCFCPTFVALLPLAYCSPHPSSLIIPIKTFYLPGDWEGKREDA